MQTPREKYQEIDRLGKGDPVIFFSYTCGGFTTYYQCERRVFLDMFA